MNKLQHLLDLRLHLRIGTTTHTQRKRDVFAHGQVRKQRVSLKHHAGIALIGRHRQQRPSVKQDAPFGRFLEARDDVERRALARAGRPEECHEFALAHVQGHVIDRDYVVVGLAQALDLQKCSCHDWFTSFIGRGAIARPPTSIPSSSPRATMTPPRRSASNLAAAWSRFAPAAFATSGSP
ncbi:spermidine/putrescine import ATP-binding PotA domain protein [Burkholderia pseudomallei MSHR5492]|nr:spermidine/putrescine import ATP-binding PotA domain protein [Burkholderia pseudomallei MSHR5492]